MLINKDLKDYDVNDRIIYLRKRIMKHDGFAILSFKDKIVCCAAQRLYGKENKLNKYEITEFWGFNLTNSASSALRGQGFNVTNLSYFLEVLLFLVYFFLRKQTKIREGEGVDILSDD